MQVGQKVKNLKNQRMYRIKKLCGPVAEIQAVYPSLYEKLGDMTEYVEISLLEEVKND